MESQETPGALPNGTVIDGKFEITGFIGAGGMGTVYRARHIELGSAVALKTLHPRFSVDQDASARFRLEAKIIAGLHHKNILAVHASGYSNNLLYMAMELIEGTSLRAMVAEGGSLSTSAALPLLIQICDAMIYAHANKVLHRDLKPDNVLIETRGQERTAKVVDFGLAKLTDIEMQRLTQTGMVVGDPHFMSPEQAQGRQADERSDIYSFGCLMYDVLSGKPPFESDSDVAVLFKQVSDEPQLFADAKAPACLRSCQSICFQAMEKNPESRYQSFQEVRNELQKLADNPDAKISASSRMAKEAAAGRGPGAHKFRRLPATVAAVALFAMLCFATAKFLHQEDADTPTDGTPSTASQPDVAKLKEAYKNLSERDARERVKELISVLQHTHLAESARKATFAELDIAETRIGFDPLQSGHAEYERAASMMRAVMEQPQRNLTMNAAEARDAIEHCRKALAHFNKIISLYQRRPTVNDTELSDINASTVELYRTYSLLIQIANTNSDYKTAKKAAKECVRLCEYAKVPPSTLEACETAFDTLIMIDVQDVDTEGAQSMSQRKLAFLKLQGFNADSLKEEKSNLTIKMREWSKQKHHPN